MAETTHPFVDWTDYPQPDGSGRSRVIEDVVIGDDVWRNRDPLTQAVIFSTCFCPARLSVAGSKVAGLFCENHEEEYVFYALFHDVAVGERVRIGLWLAGRYTARAKTVLTPESYRGNFAWLSPHVQRIVFPRGYRILGATPEGGRIGRWHGRAAIVWRRPGEFWGDIRVGLAS